jgi:hypothetical protein
MEWQGVPIFLFFLFLGLAPLTITAALMSAAIFGPNTSFSFDRYKRRFTYQTTSRFGRAGQRIEMDFADLPPLQVEKRTDSDGPDYYVLTLQLAGLPRMDLARFAGEQPALDLRQKLLAPT